MRDLKWWEWLALIAALIVMAAGISATDRDEPVDDCSAHPVVEVPLDCVHR